MVLSASTIVNKSADAARRGVVCRFGKAQVARIAPLGPPRRQKERWFATMPADVD
jgi:hypothetical protein